MPSFSRASAVFGPAGRSCRGRAWVRLRLRGFTVAVRGHWLGGSGVAVHDSRLGGFAVAVHGGSLAAPEAALGVLAGLRGGRRDLGVVRAAAPAAEVPVADAEGREQQDETNERPWHREQRCAACRDRRQLGDRDRLWWP